MVAAASAPLIVTAALAGPDLAWADALRRAHFPPERNWLRAHLTLFHHLPPAREEELSRLMQVLLRSASPPVAAIDRLLPLGRGVALSVRSPELMALREHIAEHFRHDLTPQDRVTPRLHITIQNRVEPAQAKALLEQLQPDFRVRPLGITGLSVYRYLGGPWEHRRTFPFAGPRRA